MCHTSDSLTLVTYSPRNFPTQGCDAIWESNPWNCRADHPHPVCVSLKRVFSVWHRYLGLTPNELIAEYLILITNRERFGGISTNDVFNATEFEIMPLNPDVSVQNPSHPVEAYLLALVKSHLNGGSFFFSYTWDLTRRLQVQWLEEKTDAGKALWEVVGAISNRAPNIYRIRFVFRPTIGFFGISKYLGSQYHTCRLTTPQVPAIEAY